MAQKNHWETLSEKYESLIEELRQTILDSVKTLTEDSESEEKEIRFKDSFVIIFDSPDAGLAYCEGLVLEDDEVRIICNRSEGGGSLSEEEFYLDEPNCSSLYDIMSNIQEGNLE